MVKRSILLNGGLHTTLIIAQIKNITINGVEVQPMHEGHRNRLKNRFLEEGLEALKTIKS